MMQAKRVAHIIEDEFLRPGGLVSYFRNNRSAMGCSEWVGAITMDNDYRA